MWPFWRNIKFYVFFLERSVLWQEYYDDLIHVDQLSARYPSRRPPASHSTFVER